MVVRRAGRAALGLVTWFSIAVAATTASLVFHLNLPRSRRFAREMLVSLASNELRGDLEIGRFIDVRFDHVLVEDLVLRDADGVAVLQIDVAELRPSLEHLLEGAIVFPVVEARGVRLRLRPEEADGPDAALPSFLRAFEPARPSPTPSSGGPRVVVSAIRIRDLDLDGSLLGRDGLDGEIPVLDGRLEIEDGHLDLRIWRGQGLLTEPYPFEAELLQVEGRIDTRPEVGIELYAHLRTRRDDQERAQDDVRARVVYAQPEAADGGDPRHLTLVAHLDPVLAETLEDAGIDAARPLQGPLWGTVRLEGPENDLELRLDLDTIGGQLDIDGRIAGSTVTVGVETERLALQHLVEGVPDLPVGGRVEVRIAPPPETDPDAPTLALSADLDPFDVAGWRIPPLRAEGVVEADGSLRIERFEAPAGGGEVSGSGRVSPDGAVAVAVRASLPALHREPNLARLLPGARGSGTTEVDVRIAGEEVFLDGRLVLLDVDIPPLHADRLVIDGRIEGRPERPVVRLSAETTGTSLAGYPLGRGDVRIDGGPSRYGARVRFQGPRGRALALDATAQRQGADRWEVTAPHLEVTAGPRAEQDYDGSVASVVFDLEAGSVAIEKLDLVQGTQRIGVDGIYGGEGETSLTASLQDVELGAVAGLVPGLATEIGGRIDASLAVSGELPDHPVFQLEGGVRDGRFGTATELAGAYRIALDDGEASVDVLLDLGTDGGALGLSGSGLLDTFAETADAALLGGVYELELVLAELDVAKLARAFGVETPITAAHTTGTVDVSGSPYAPNVRAEVEVPALALADGPTLPVVTSFEYDTGVLVGNASLGDPEAPLVSAEASLLLDLATLITSPEIAFAALETLPWRLALRSDPRRLDDLPAPWRDQVPVGFGPTQVAGSITLSGGSTPMRGDGTLAIDWDPAAAHLLPCRGLGRPRAQLFVRIRNGRTEIELGGFLEDEEVFEAFTTSETPFDAWVAGTEAAALPLTEVVARVSALPVDAVPGLCGRATGTLTGEVGVTGLFGERPSARALLATPDFRVSQGQLIRATARAEADGEAGATMSVRVRWPGNERAELDLSLPLVWGGPEQVVPDRAPGATLDTEARFVAAPIAPLLLLAQDVAEGQGFLTGEVRVHGPLDGFEVDGQVVLEEGAIDVVPLGQQLRDVGGTLDFRGNWVRLVDVSARDGNGRARLDGSLAFRGPTPTAANLAINTRAFPVRQEGSVLARVSTSAVLGARFEGERANVDIDLRSLDVALPDQSTSTVQALDDHPDIEIVGLESGEVVVLDETPYPIVFRVQTASTGWVRRSDFSSEIRANLEATVDGDEIRFAGTVELLRGLFEVFGKRFEVQRGGLAFTGSDELNPGVSLVAEHELPSGDTVTVIVGGTLLAPTVDFASTHPTCRADEEVIALLVSGACSVADTFAASGESVAAEQQALNFLAGITAGVLTLGARRQFGDVVPVLVIESGDAAFQSARVRAGFRADSLIPDFLRGIVRGIYVEGQVTAEQGAAVTGEGEAASEGPTGAAFSGGFLFELRFPYDLVGRTTFESSSNAWSVDLTWEP